MNTKLIRPIGDLARSGASRYGQKPLFVSEEREVSFADYDAITDRIASWLAANGIAKGDRVAAYMRNSVELLLVYTAIAKAGAVTVFVNEQLTPREIRYILLDSATHMVVTDGDHLGAVREVRPDCPELGTVVVLGDAPLAAGERPYAETEVHPVGHLPSLDVDDDCWIGYTSGTTGDPKGALLTHRNVTWVSACCIDAYGLEETDRMLCTLPLFHSYAVNMCYVQVIAAGMTEYVLSRFSPQKSLDSIEKHRITVLPQVPAGYTYLSNVNGSQDTSSLRLCISAGATLVAKVLADFRAAYGLDIHDGWGSTETSMDSIAMRVGTPVLPASCGLPFPGLSVRIVDENDLDVPVGDWGEMIIRGPNVMREYINKPELTAKALKNGFYHTGDIAYQDKNGFVFIVDRLKDLIISGGYNIAPKEIEDVILMYEGVLETAVVGIHDDAKGECPRAYVVPREGAVLSEEKIVAHCRKYLAAYKMPTEIVITERIPRTSSGKVMRYRLRQEAG